MIYDRARYEYRGKFAKTRFKRDCLAEYAEVFKTVCVDAAYYTFPSQQYLEGMVSQTREDFLFGLKVTDAITIKKYPKLDRFGEQAGKPNENFLNADLFVKAFLKPCEAVRASFGLLIDSIKEEDPEARAAGRALIAEGQAAGPKRRTFVFVNNRLEGNAISTIAAMTEPGQRWRVAMIPCLDVDYREATAYAAGLAFHDWSDAAPAAEKVVPAVGVERYQPGQFFRRELPCLLAVLRELPPVALVIAHGLEHLCEVKAAEKKAKRGKKKAEAELGLEEKAEG